MEKPASVQMLYVGSYANVYIPGLSKSVTKPRRVPKGDGTGLTDKPVARPFECSWRMASGLLATRSKQFQLYRPPDMTDKDFKELSRMLAEAADDIRPKMIGAKPISKVPKREPLPEELADTPPPEATTQPDASASTESGG